MATILEVETERAILQQQRKVLQDEVDRLQTEVEKLGVSTVELDLKRAEIERSEIFLKAIWDQKERTGVELKGIDRGDRTGSG